MRYFKIISPERIGYHYIILLKDYKGKYVIGTHKLDMRKNSDAFTLYLITMFDSKSEIEFYGKRFIVKDWNINNADKEIEIYI